MNRTLVKVAAMTLTLAGSMTFGAGCTVTGANAETTSEAAPSSSPPPKQRPAPPDYAGFADWQAAFRIKALGEGILPKTFDNAFQGVSLNETVMRLDSKQPEFSRPVWEYLDSAASPSRIKDGQEKAAEHDRMLRLIATAYGVDAKIILAIWGLESAYGHNYGSIPVIESLATLAFEGRRRVFAEEQLLVALRILQSGDVSPSRMVGSWAGAMGHTQFIPTSYQQYAQDFDGDGRRDVWSKDPGDALASTANYLARFGWRAEEPWGVEIRLPEGFDYRLADQAIRRPVADWRAMGVTALTGELPDHGETAILLPAGARGPAFAVFHNFRVIKRYNNSTFYAMGVALLGDRIKGGGQITAEWPRGDRTLSRTEKKEMQQLLTSLGHDTGGADGLIGPNSRKAIRSFQAARGMTPDGYADAKFLDKVRAASGG
ncbi:MAG: lytic murein transglycosylase [Pikeienuella sp.]